MVSPEVSKMHLSVIEQCPEPKISCAEAIFLAWNPPIKFFLAVSINGVNCKGSMGSGAYFEVYDGDRCIRYLLKLLLTTAVIYFNPNHVPYKPFFCPIGSRIFATMTTRSIKVSNFVSAKHYL